MSLRGPSVIVGSDVVSGETLAGALWSKPAAMTVTRTASPIESSMTLPKMMLASGCATEWMISAAWVTSESVTSVPPTMFIKMPRAPSIEASSRGEVMAARAAFTARPSPVEVPTPMMAVPAFRMMALTSAKSVLMSPGTVIRSVTPRTAESRTSSAILKASSIEVSAAVTESSRSLGMTMSVSTFSRSDWMPFSAWVARRLPSKENGRVTTPIVKMPNPRAISATTGAAPVPVPPPSPAVMKTMSVSISASSISPR